MRLADFSRHETIGMKMKCTPKTKKASAVAGKPSSLFLEPKLEPGPQKVDCVMQDIRPKTLRMNRREPRIRGSASRVARRAVGASHAARWAHLLLLGRLLLSFLSGFLLSHNAVTSFLVKQMYVWGIFPSMFFFHYARFFLEEILNRDAPILNPPPKSVR
jgi:hypothetical protein